MADRPLPAMNPEELFPALVQKWRERVHTAKEFIQDAERIELAIKEHDSGYALALDQARNRMGLSYRSIPELHSLLNESRGKFQQLLAALQTESARMQALHEELDKRKHDPGPPVGIGDASKEKRP